jgi:hypothetical protein
MHKGVGMGTGTSRSKRPNPGARTDIHSTAVEEFAAER